MTYSKYPNDKSYNEGGYKVVGCEKGFDAGEKATEEHGDSNDLSSTKPFSQSSSKERCR